MTIVKILGTWREKIPCEWAFRRQLPDAEPVFGNCRFVFGPDEKRYDWLVVYERFPTGGPRFSGWIESHPGDPANSILVTGEPSSIKVYDDAFLRQFGYVLTGHEPESIDRPGVIRRQPGLRWFYGAAEQRTLDGMLAAPPPEKTAEFSTVCSTKQQRHTLHSKRYAFTNRLKTVFPELEIFGMGVRPVKDKAEALDAFKYHLAIENHRCDHWWTEKIADAFLGFTLPFYFGCTNLADYFPEESFVEVDIHDFDKAVDTIRSTMANNEFEKRFEAIKEARHRVLTKYNLFAEIAAIIDGPNTPPPNQPRSTVFHRRHRIRYGNPINLAVYLGRSASRYFSGYSSSPKRGN